MGTVAVQGWTLLAGIGITALGLRGALISMGLFTLLASVWVFANGALRDMSARAA